MNWHHRLQEMQQALGGLSNEMWKCNIALIYSVLSHNCYIHTSDTGLYWKEFMLVSSIIGCPSELLARGEARHVAAGWSGHFSVACHSLQQWLVFVRLVGLSTPSTSDLSFLSCLLSSQSSATCPCSWSWLLCFTGDCVVIQRVSLLVYGEVGHWNVLLFFFSLLFKSSKS